MELNQSQRTAFFSPIISTIVRSSRYAVDRIWQRAAPMPPPALRHTGFAPTEDRSPVSKRQLWTADPMQIRLRTGGPDDRDRVARFLAAMDRDGLYQRYFAHGEAANLALLGRLDASDGGDRVGLLALAPDGEVLGHAEYVAIAGSAEYALMLLPQVRGIGLGRRLLAALLEIAKIAGQRKMHGIILASNTPALQLSLKLGFRVVPGAERGTVIVSRELAPAPIATPGLDSFSADFHPTPPVPHDPDRAPLHRRTFPRAPFRPRCGQVQRVAADAVGSGEET